MKEITTSLPSRERGLKFVDKLKHVIALGSLPSRERGLKSLVLCVVSDEGFGSLPSRERGLKFIGCEARKCVAPSLPSRERGLKFEADQGEFPAGRRSLHGSVD